MASVFLLIGFLCTFCVIQAEEVHNVCARSFFLSEQDTCLPCNCKGHAHTCHDITGICIDCQDHSTGDFCERCEHGYVLQEFSDGRHECRPCACPIATETNNFATHCDVKGTTLRCVCEDGYSGNYCERCAPGYYGNPMRVGDLCKKCDCNGNSDPNLIINECHNVTGRCLHCYGDTAGDNCERCAPGYYGDAISAKNCRKCECNKCGTMSCDDRTGVCHCKPGVTGRLCDQCEEGSFGFSTCTGCRRCECAAAARSPSCNTLTHSCQCHPGAGGRYCERCLPGYWKYSSTGCQKCDCPEGSCDAQTGECMPEMSQVSECSVDCDECIWHLIGDVRRSNTTVDQLRNSVLNISTGAAAHDRLKYYNYSVQTLRVQFVGWRNKSDGMRKQAAELEEETQLLHTDTHLLTQQEDDALAVSRQVDNETQQSFTLAKVLTSNLTSVNVLVEDIIRDWELYREQQDVDPEVQKQKQAEAQRMINGMATRDLSPKQPLATQENANANQLLQRVRQMEKSVLLMEGRLPVIREMMKQHSMRISQGNIHLNRAGDLLQQTHNTHTHNLLRLQRTEDQQQRLTQNHQVVSQTLTGANHTLAEAKMGVTDLEVMVTELKQYHAELDGASGQIQSQIDELSQVDEDLVLRATEHAQQLQTHAQELQRDLKGGDASGFVQKALEASNVYDRIVKSIGEAESLSTSGLNSSSRTQDAVNGITSQVNFLRKQSDHVHAEAVTHNIELQEVTASVVDIQKYIEETQEMMKTSRRKLDDIIDNIHKIQRAQGLQISQDVAEEARNHSEQVLQEVTPISQQVEQWSRNMRNNQYSTAAYEQAVNSAHNTVEDLSQIVPQLLTKLRDVEEKKPHNNVSTNILRIRNLITQARNVANKIQVSMKFNGQSSVELHPPAKADEMRAVTSISLYVRVDPDTDPIEDRFLLYLGDKNGRKDYMGLAIKNDNLVFVYNLGGDDVEIPLSSKPVSSWPPIFNHIKVERLGRHGKVYLTVPSQKSVAEQKFIQKGEADGTDSLLHLDPKDTVFIIGGVPPNVKLPPALSLAPFVGCVELATLNNDVISLYNFKKLHEMNVVTSAPCPRYKLAFSQGRVTSFLFDGSGYALVKNIERRGKMSILTRFDIEVRTVANNGVLFLMVKQENFFVLELKNGFLRLVYDFGFAGGPVVMESNTTKVQINDARYHEVSVIYHQSKKVILLVDRISIKTMENEKKTLPFSDIYIGGAPSTLLQSRPEFSSLVGLKGCVKGFQYQKKDFNLLEEPGTIGISSGCLEESFMSRKAYFTGEGYLGSTAKFTPFRSFEGGMNFRTIQPSGLLFYHQDGTDEFSLSLENGAVVLHSKGTRVKSHKKNYNDGRPHFLVASVTKQKYQLVVDDKDKQEKKKPDLSDSPSDGLKDFYYGGSSSSSINNFTGCISHAYISRQDRDIEAEDFQRYSYKVGVSLQDCPALRHAVYTPAALRQVSRDTPDLLQGILGWQHDASVSEETEAMPCYLSSHPRAVRNAHYYSGSAHSRHEYDNIAKLIREKSHFSMSVRTRSSSGLIASLYGTDSDDFMALFISAGKLVYTFGSGANVLWLQSKHTHNDGRWHDVVFIRDGNVGRLIVDGMFMMEEKLHASFALNLQDPLYMGGVPPGHAHKHIQVSSGFSGCVRDLRLNGRFVSSTPRSFGVTPCHEGGAEPGVYFSDEGGYIKLDSFSPGSRFQVGMELRPRVASAMLLHAHTPEENLSVYLQGGQVFLQVNNGTILTKVSPKTSLCDGHWHRISVTRAKGELRLDVDSDMSQVVDPTSHDRKVSKAPLYIGGAPDPLLEVGAWRLGSFTGCVRKVSIDNRPVDLGHASMVSGAVDLGGCPAG